MKELPVSEIIQTPECNGALESSSETPTHGHNGDLKNNNLVVSGSEEDIVNIGQPSFKIDDPDEAKNVDSKMKNISLVPGTENVIDVENCATLVNNSNLDLTTSSFHSCYNNSNPNTIADHSQTNGNEETDICGVQVDSSKDVSDIIAQSEDNPIQSIICEDSSTNLCTVSVDNVCFENPKNNIEEERLVSTNTNRYEHLKNEVSSACQTIVHCIISNIMDNMIGKVMQNSVAPMKQSEEIVGSIEIGTRSEEDSNVQSTDENSELLGGRIPVTAASKVECSNSLDAKELNEKCDAKERMDTCSTSNEHKKTSETEELTEESKTVETKDLNDESDFDDTEKSDGSDSGIGSELIDEVITKNSSDSSSSTCSDEFATARECWVTPCISFAEMSEIDFGAAPKLTMPTFDDLALVSDVFPMDKKQSDEFVNKEIDTDQMQDNRQYSDSSQSTVGAPDNEHKNLESDEDIDIGSIDDDRTEPIAYVPPTLLRELPSIPSTSHQTFKSNLKRTAGYSDGVPANKRFRSERIRFDSVSVYYFPRAQGFTCVPSQGGSTLGMSWQHSHVQTFTLSQYALEQRRVHQRIARSPICSPGQSVDSNDDTDSDEPLSDTEFDSDSSYTLQPVKIRQRRVMLRAAGVDKIDAAEKNECKQIRISREFCGCTCEGYCDPEICACALAGIKCQVDRQSFPCGCSRDCCGNPKGRIEFNPVRVHSHYIQTMMRIKAQKKDEDDVTRMYDYQQFHNFHPSSEFEPTSLSSFYQHHHPQYHHHVHSELLSNFELQHQMHSCYVDMGVYGNMAPQDKMSDSYSELIPYSGGPFNNNTPTEMYNSFSRDSSMTSSYPYSTADSDYQKEVDSNSGTDGYSQEVASGSSQYSQEVSSGADQFSEEMNGTLLETDLKSDFNQAQYYAVPEPGLPCEPSKELSTENVEEFTTEVKEFSTESVSLNEKLDVPSEESENFGEIISKTMADEVIV